MNRVANLVAVALVAALSLSSSGCVLVAVPALVAAAVLPETALPESIAAVGEMNHEEGIVFGSLAIPVDPSANIVENWGGMDYSIPGAGNDAAYSLIIFGVDRRGVVDQERRWKADCRPDGLCRFVAKLGEGDYVVNTIRISKRDDDQYMLEFGQILTRVDMRFTVAPRTITYVGRLSVSPPVVDSQGKAQLPLEIADASPEDAVAVGLTEDDAYSVILLSNVYRSRPVESYSFSR